MKLNPAERAALAQYLIQRFRAVVRTKGDLAEITTVATVFDVARLFGANVPTTADFLDRFWTTLGPVIFSARGTGPLAPHARVVFHEVTHAVQFWRAPLDYVRRYLTSTGRAELEAEAERAAIEAWWLLTGELPATRGDLDRTRHGYALDDSHADLTVELLDTACTSVSCGVLSTDVGLYVLSWLREHAPTAIVGTVHA